MIIGLEEFRDTDSLKLPGLLIQPFIQVVQEKRY
jgi:hypothetical protein